MTVYWSEITIKVNPNAPALVGDQARECVERDFSELAPAVGPIAKLTWKGREVTGDLVMVVLRQAIEAKGAAHRVSFKLDDTIKPRGPDAFTKLGANSALQRENPNTLSAKHNPYVIVGCGTAAIVNHTTLRQTKWGKERVGDARIVHVGFEDPWSHYNKHEMGQYPQMLGMPGYTERPNLDQEGTDEPRDSTKFAGNTKAEVERLREHLQSKGLELEIYRYAVGLIQPRGQRVSDDLVASLVTEGLDLDRIATLLDEPHPDHWGRYRLLCIAPDGELGWGYAGWVDICTGAGKPRSVTEAMVGKATYDQVRTRFWQPPESWSETLKRRRIMTGTEGLYVDSDWTVGARYCVMGGGGVGVNMVERAERTDKRIDWLATGTLHDSFPIERNDILLRQPHTWNHDRSDITAEGAPMSMGGLGKGRDDQLALLDPAKKKWRFGQGTDIKTAVLANDGVTITFEASKRNNTYARVSDPLQKGQAIASKVRDYWEQDSALTNGAFPFSGFGQQKDGALADLQPAKYDRLIRASGQDIRDVGQGERLTAGFELEPIRAPSDGRMVGLQSKDGSVRILGASGTGNAALVENTKSGPYLDMTEYHATLPTQGRIMLVGFVFSGLNVATANHYFDPDTRRKERAEDDLATRDVAPNTNVHTMSIVELIAAIGDAGLARKVARARRLTQSGFLTIDALKDRLRTMAQEDQGARIDLLAYGWERSMSTVKLEDINKADRQPLQARTQDARLTDWILHARAERKRDYGSVGELIAELQKRHATERARRLDGGEPLPEGWESTIDTLAEQGRLTVGYRLADPYVF